VTFLFTDIEGSSRLWESAPVSMRAALARHDEFVRSASASFTMDAYGHASEADLNAAADALGAYRQRTLARRSVVRMDEHRATPAGP
jgi:hypothetical protein